MAIKKIKIAPKTILRKFTKPVKAAKPVKKAKISSASTPSAAWFVYSLFGVLFGYFLSKAGATDYDVIVDMFRPSNVHIDRMPSGFAFHWEALRLYGVIGMAIAVIALGLFLLERAGSPTRSGKPLQWESLSWDPNRIWGSLLFGTGWALSGTCPGTALAQIGEGKWVAFSTVIGIAAGVWAYHRFNPKSSDEESVC